VMNEDKDLKRWQLGERMMRHPVATGVSGLLLAAVSTALGSIHSPGMAAAMAVLGLIVGAPIGATLAESGGADTPVPR
jgi:hypothetical protein